MARVEGGLGVVCEDPRPHAWSMCASYFIPTTSGFPTESPTDMGAVAYLYELRVAWTWVRNLLSKPGLVTCWVRQVFNSSAAKNIGRFNCEFTITDHRVTLKPLSSNSSSQIA